MKKVLLGIILLIAVLSLAKAESSEENIGKYAADEFWTLWKENKGENIKDIVGNWNIVATECEGEYYNPGWIGSELCSMTLNDDGTGVFRDYLMTMDQKFQTSICQIEYFLNWGITGKDTLWIKVDKHNLPSNIPSSLYIEYRETLDEVFQFRYEDGFIIVDVHGKEKISHYMVYDDSWKETTVQNIKKAWRGETQDAYIPNYVYFFLNEDKTGKLEYVYREFEDGEIKEKGLLWYGSFVWYPTIKGLNIILDRDFPYLSMEAGKEYCVEMHSEYGTYLGAHLDNIEDWGSARIFLDFETISLYAVDAEPRDTEEIAMYEVAKKDAGNVLNITEKEMLAIGDKVYFGQYEQDNNLDNGSEDIVWRILAIEDGRALLLSEYLINADRFEDYNVKYTNWETGKIRTWLNENFIQGAFSPEEQSSIAETLCKAGDKYRNENDTIDKVFLLSLEEVEQYIPLRNDRCALATTYTSHIEYFNEELNGYSSWWLRSGTDGQYASAVTNEGFISERQVEKKGLAGIRPAIWYDIPEEISIEQREYEKTAPVIDFSNLKVGDKLYFGSYEQDYDVSNGKELVAWLVLSVNKENEEVLLISEDILDYGPFETNIYTGETWQYSQLHEWLNKDFYVSAFSPEEQLQLVSFTNEGGGDIGKISILTISQIEELLPTAEDRETKFSDYVKNQYNIYPDAVNWWIRTDNVLENFSDGYHVLEETGQFEKTMLDYNNGIRPIIKICFGEKYERMLQSSTESELDKKFRGEVNVNLQVNYTKDNENAEIKSAETTAPDKVVQEDIGGGESIGEPGEIINLQDGDIFYTSQDVEVKWDLVDGAGIYYINAYYIDDAGEDWFWGDSVWGDEANNPFVIPAGTLSPDEYRIEVNAWIGTGGHSDEELAQDSVYITVVEGDSSGDSSNIGTDVGFITPEDGITIQAGQKLELEWTPIQGAQVYSIDAYPPSGIDNWWEAFYNGELTATIPRSTLIESSYQIELCAWKDDHLVGGNEIFKQTITVYVHDKFAEEETTAEETTSDTNELHTSGDFVYLIQEDGTAAFAGFNGDGELRIPESIDGYTVTAIADNACYWNSAIESVHIPATVKTIGNGAFAWCGFLKRVNIRPGVTSIGDQAFMYTGLIDITLPDTITHIGDSVLANCDSLLYVDLPQNLVSMGDGVLAECKNLKEIEIPQGVQNIPSNAFFLCPSLESVSLPEGLTEIGEMAFYGCSALKKVTIPSSVKVIGEWAFSGCTSLKNYDLPAGVELGEGAFFGCPQ